jgi:hypothetical protein
MSVHELPAPPLPADDVARRERHVTRPDESDNPFKLVARYRKARAIATALHALPNGFAVADVEGIGASLEGRELAAKVAGTNVPSETTWALVVELYREVTT